MTKLFFALLANPLLAASLAQALGQLAGILNAFGLVAVFGGLLEPQLCRKLNKCGRSSL